MRIAVASGKGGTGKTTLAVGLALTAPEPCHLIDADVEEPNSRLLLGPTDLSKRPITIPVPVVDLDQCVHCGDCAKICEFHAMAYLADKPVVFADLCHGCGGCMRVCPTDAIQEVPLSIGELAQAARGDILLTEGRLDVGKALPTPVIRQTVTQTAPDRPLTIVDSPPGTSCSMMTAVRNADMVILVTEPTPFGLNDLVLAVETLRQLEQPFGVVINRADAGDDRVLRYCEKEGIALFAAIPHDRKVAEAYSRGRHPVEAVPGMKETFEQLWTTVLRAAAEQTAGGPS